MTLEIVPFYVSSKHLFISGETDKLVELLLDGYDHITDIVDEDNTPIFEAVSKENQPDTLSFLQSILTFEVKYVNISSVNFLRSIFYSYGVGI